MSDEAQVPESQKQLVYKPWLSAAAAEAALPTSLVRNRARYTGFFLSGQVQRLMELCVGGAKQHSM